VEYYGYTEEELKRLLYLIDTKELDIKLTKKEERTIENNIPYYIEYIDKPYRYNDYNNYQETAEERYYYKTDEDEELIRNNYGCYAIYNATLKIIYIGETITSFHKRWSQHYRNIDKDTKRKQTLLKHPDTICTVIYVSNGDKEETENIEAQTIEWYRNEYPEWTILGGTYRDNCYYKGAN
jgi:hypothetical protein